MPNPHYLSDLIEGLRARCSSLVLNWGEDTDQWEIEMITGGDRFTAVGKTLTRAVVDADRLLSALEELNEEQAR